MQKDIEKILITENQIRDRVKTIGENISKDYADKELVLVSILRGGLIFLADLLRAITIPVTIDFMAISSYGGYAESSGVVQLIKDLGEPVLGKNVLLVEDIIDTGLTLNYLMQSLKAKQPLTLEVCTLLDKSVRRIVDLDLAYKGFDVPDLFVVGYGLDFNQKYRNLPFIGVLREDVIQR
ncbi:MAG TPA: hypoxanthine phosphoribosyltransferase [Actinobacteria bacterium]|nr:hypoxanthine phosphoribosyltransferase [Actinomycetes bacterium]HEX21767.1 hypoxanthine phosphoribosyltransferase [Actinomycetota bacterium]